MNIFIDSGVLKTLLSEKDWNLVKPMQGKKPAKLKKCHTKFSLFGANVRLPMRGRVKCGKEVKTVVYVVEGETQSLLGLRDAKALGVISTKPEGRLYVEDVNMVTNFKKVEPKLEGVVSGNQTQIEIDAIMEKITERHQDVFKGLGRAKVDPIHIEMNPSFRPVKQIQESFQGAHRGAEGCSCLRTSWLRLRHGVDQQRCHPEQEMYRSENQSHHRVFRKRI